MIHNIGQLSIWLCLVSIGASSICYLFVNHKKSIPLKNIARICFMLFLCTITFASIQLMFFILNHHFEYSYVVEYSSRTLPLQYLISSFWAGQEGSFLLWVLIGGWLGSVLMVKSGEREPQVMTIYNLNNIFLTVLLIKQSPFRMIADPPADGFGLNLLLQDPWMVIHPPIVFLGYAAFIVPFAYAIAALWKREYDKWIRPAMPWTIFAFVTLGAGIIIGGYWSYKVLGWGGYWAWDPVENASLLPWLSGMALMHGMILQRNKGMLKKTNFVLAAFSFILVIYCTFLTRSGILADFSVHSFVDLGITGWLVLFMGAFCALFVLFFLLRAKEISSRVKKEPLNWLSREFGIVMAMILLCLSSIITGIGTSAPLITRVLEKASKVSTQFYVDTNMPLAILMLILLCYVPLLTWGRNKFGDLLPKLWGAVAGAIIASVLMLKSGYPGRAIMLMTILAGATAGMNLPLAARFLQKRVTLSSGAVAHLGFGLMCLGIVASSVYDRSERVLLQQATTHESLGFEMEFQGARPNEEGSTVRWRFPITLRKGNTAFFAVPDFVIEPGPNGRTKRFPHPYIKRGIISDLYISPIEYRPGNHSHDHDHQLVIKKGEKVLFNDYEFVFEGFETRGMTDGERRMSVRANLLVSYKNEKPVQIKPVFVMGSDGNMSDPVELPGANNAHIVLQAIDATSKTITLSFYGATSKSEEIKNAEPPSFIAEVSIKPGMTILWLGTILMIAGGIFGVFRRIPLK